MDFKTIIQSLKKRQFLPLYFLHGEEPYYIEEIVQYIEKNALDDAAKSFNQTILYGKDIDFKIVLDNARRYPVMSDFQVVIIKEAQDLKTLDSEQMMAYFENPLPSTILVFAHKYKKLDKRKKITKTLEKTEKAGKACVFESEKLYDNQLPGWIENYVRDQKVSIDPEAVQLLAEYLGNDLAKVSNELDKLSLNLAADKNITKDLIQRNIGISKDFNVFELQNALARRDVLRANLITNYFIANPKSNPLPMVISALYNYFSKLYLCKFLPNLNDETIAGALSINKFFAKDYRVAATAYSRPQVEQTIMALRDYDLRSKGVFVELPGDEFNSHVPHGELLKELVYKILH